MLDMIHYTCFPFINLPGRLQECLLLLLYANYKEYVRFQCKKNWQSTSTTIA